VNRTALTVSISLLLIGLVGGATLMSTLWLKTRVELKDAVATIDTDTAVGAHPDLPMVDGTVQAGEYAHALQDEGTGMRLTWTVDGERIFVGLHSPGHGWLALGLAPDGPMMRGADILMGYVTGGKAVLEDQYGDSPVSHARDVDDGGSEDVDDFAGSEDEGGTTLEWVRPLQTGDELDKPLVAGEMFIQLAYAEQDDWTSYHGQTRNTLTVRFFDQQGGNDGR